MGVTRTSANPSDWISVVEASYNLEGSDSPWLRAVLDEVSPLLGRCTNALGWTFRRTPPLLPWVAFPRGPSNALSSVAHLAPALPPDK